MIAVNNKHPLERVDLAEGKDGVCSPLERGFRGVLRQVKFGCMKILTKINRVEEHTPISPSVKSPLSRGVSRINRRGFYITFLRKFTIDGWYIADLHEEEMILVKDTA